MDGTASFPFLPKEITSAQVRGTGIKEFADYPVEKSTGQYDLLIIDHPWTGRAAETECVLPLDEYLSGEYLEDQLNNSIGHSHLNYNYDGRQWAITIDAAAPVASYRPDLLEKNWRENVFSSLSLPVNIILKTFAK